MLLSLFNAYNEIIGNGQFREVLLHLSAVATRAVIRSTGYKFKRLVQTCERLTGLNQSLVRRPKLIQQGLQLIAICSFHTKEKVNNGLIRLAFFIASSIEKVTNPLREVASKLSVLEHKRCQMSTINKQIYAGI